MVLHRVEEPSQRIRNGRKVGNHDKKSCVTIFKAAKITTTSEDIKFCCRIGEKKGRA